MNLSTRKDIKKTILFIDKNINVFKENKTKILFIEYFLHKNCTINSYREIMAFVDYYYNKGIVKNNNVIEDFILSIFNTLYDRITNNNCYVKFDLYIIKKYKNKLNLFQMYNMLRNFDFNGIQSKHFLLDFLIQNYSIYELKKIFSYELFNFFKTENNKIIKCFYKKLLKDGIKIYKIFLKNHTYFKCLLDKKNKFNSVIGIDMYNEIVGFKYKFSQLKKTKNILEMII